MVVARAVEVRAAAREAASEEEKAGVALEVALGQAKNTSKSNTRATAQTLFALQ